MTIREEVQSSVLDYFSGPLGFTELDAQAQLAIQWIGDGTLDSFAILEAIIHFEQMFSIHFRNEQLMNVEIETLGGLIDAIILLHCGLAE